MRFLLGIAVLEKTTRPISIGTLAELSLAVVLVNEWSCKRKLLEVN